MNLPCTVYFLCLTVEVVFQREVCCVNIALTIHQKHTYKFFLFTERSRPFLQSTEQSLSYG